MAEELKTVSVQPGEEIALRFECDRCEGFRWRAVNPSRNIQRALKRLDEGDLDGVRYFLDAALPDAEELRRYAESVASRTGGSDG